MPRPPAPEPGAHGPDEIYDKFTVVKSKHVINLHSARDAVDNTVLKAFSPSDELTHKDEWIFVVRPESNDGAAVAAIEAYAKVCRETYPDLADALEAKLREKGLV